MDQTIFLPSADETRQLMEHAWQEFQQQAGTQGISPDTLSLMHDIFIWGYCMGTTTPCCSSATSWPSATSPPRQ